MSNLLNVLLWSPALGAFLILFVSESNRRAIKVISYLVTIVPFVLSLFMFLINGCSFSEINETFSVKISWIGYLDIFYSIRMDGLSILPVLFAIFFFVILIRLFCNMKKIQLVLVLLIETMLIGSLLSYGLFTFYLFLELMIILSFLFLHFHGVFSFESRQKMEGPPIRTNIFDHGVDYVAMKFVVFNSVGSSLILISFLGMQYSMAANSLLALMIFSGLIIKMALFPFNTWFVDLCRCRELLVTVVLFFILAISGMYGIVRFVTPFFREYAIFAGCFGVFNFLYGTICIFRIKGIEKNLPYLLMSSTGFVIALIFLTGIPDKYSLFCFLLIILPILIMLIKKAIRGDVGIIKNI